MSHASQRILVVEDERIIALDLRGALEELGYTVVGTAATCADAQAMAAEHMPDLVLMDIRLADEGDGIETARKICSRKNVPVVYLSANADLPTVQRALASAPGGYLAKPYNEQTLHTTIQVALARHGAETRLRAENVLLVQRHAALEREAEELTAESSRLRLDALLDPLTGLYNRRHFDVLVACELRSANENGHSVGLIFIDLDRFKTINDTFGHQAGDAVLRAAAREVRATVGARGVACRFGGEELAVVVPCAAVEQTLALAEEIRQRIAGLVIEEHGGAPITVTASVGVAASEREIDDPEDLLAAADEALYAAKAGGRNRVCEARALLPLARSA